ncbi:MAG TPA: abortive infection system antitoxin AbiGi family protein [Terriglobales bacterium]
MPWTGKRAVCFTECPWSSLLSHANAYSPYAVGFKKPRVFAAGGGPVYYVRADHFEEQKRNKWDPDVYTFVTPFWPPYLPKDKRGLGLLGGKFIDFSHEREWRIPHDFTFEFSQIEFVIVDKYGDVARFPKDLKDAIGREKFLIMEVYKRIESLWPVHKV